MPGIDLDLDLPAGSDTMAVLVAKTAAALSEIEDDLAGPILPSEMDINAALSMNGNALTNIGSLQLAAGNPSTKPGAIYYKNGEIYVRDLTGEIRVTLLGQLDITAATGFTGDYGQPGVTATASYDNASQQYRFLADTGVYADLVCDDLFLEGANGSVELGVDPAINTSRLFNFKSLPTSGISLLAYDAANSALVDASTVTISNANTFSGNVTINGTLTTSVDPKHSDEWEYAVPLNPAAKKSNGDYSGALLQNFTSSGAGTDFYSQILQHPRKGDRFKTIKMYTTGAGTVTWQLCELQADGTTVAVVASGTNGFGGDNVFTATGGLPYTTLTNCVYFFILAFSAGSTTVFTLRYTLDHP